MNAVLKTKGAKSAYEIAADLAAEIAGDPKTRDYSGVAKGLMDAANESRDVLWQLAEVGAQEVANQVLANRAAQTRQAAARLQKAKRRTSSVRVTGGISAKRRDNLARQELAIATAAAEFTWMTITVGGTKLAECRQVELDRAIKKAGREAQGKARRSDFLASIRKQLPNHKVRVTDVLTEAKIKKIAKETKFSKEDSLEF